MILLDTMQVYKTRRICDTWHCTNTLLLDTYHHTIISSSRFVAWLHSRIKDWLALALSSCQGAEKAPSGSGNNTRPLTPAAVAVVNGSALACLPATRDKPPALCSWSSQRHHFSPHLPTFENGLIVSGGADKNSNLYEPVVPDSMKLQGSQMLRLVSLAIRTLSVLWTFNWRVVGTSKCSNIKVEIPF